MKEKNALLKKILIEAGQGNLNISNYYRFDCFKEFWELLYNDVEKFSKFTFDGRFEKILFEQLAKSYKQDLSYSEFLCAVKAQLEKLSVPCIIIIPLNFLDNSKLKHDIKLSDNLVLFKTEKRQRKRCTSLKCKKTDTPLEKYFREKVYTVLLRDHIEDAKDKNFFNFPTLTIVTNNIDRRVIDESGRIVETVYSLIRMLDFENELAPGGWGYIFGTHLKPANTYGVYYNEEGLSEIPSGCKANGYGYSMRFKFNPILDISTDGFLSSIDKFSAILTKYITYCFIDKTCHTQEELVRISKWQNAFQIFNNAYELAASEKYDSSLILLLVVLESLLIKNSGNKKEKLILALEEFFKEATNFSPEFIRENISEAYKARNKFIHEGDGVENEHVYAKPLNSYQGIFPGMKPFSRLGLYHQPSNIKTIRNIFKITIEVILQYKEV